MNFKNLFKRNKTVTKTPSDPEREAMRELIHFIDKSEYRKPDTTCVVYPGTQKTWAGEKVYEFVTLAGKMSIKADTYKDGQVTGYFVSVNGSRWLRFEADSTEGRLLSKFRSEAMTLLATISKNQVSSAQQTLNFIRSR